ncbi:hypothetical protein FIBSPDRAFT_848430, partial [Athelia psychrophila]
MENYTLDKLPYATGTSWDLNIVRLSGTRATMLKTAELERYRSPEVPSLLDF